MIDKTNLAPTVGAALEVMDRDAKGMRGERPFVFTKIETSDGLETIIAFIEQRGMLRQAA